MKLEGMNPVRILTRELQESKHEKKQYIKVLLQTVQGSDDSYRYKLTRRGKHYLEVEEQVQCLIEQARDPNILGRTWIGWSPHI